MARLLVVFSWLGLIAAAFNFAGFATASRLSDGSHLLRWTFDGKQEDQSGRKQMFTGPDAKIPMRRLPKANGYLNFYALPVGQGSGQIIQCPSGDITIIDLGSMESDKKGFWASAQIKAFLDEHDGLIKNIVITHNDKDHISLFSEVFSSPFHLNGLINIYISCTYDGMPEDLKEWINNIEAFDKLRTFNRGHRCGYSNEPSCGHIALCERDPDIMFKVLSANAANCVLDNLNKYKFPNTDSIVIEIAFMNFKMQLNGDFEDEQPNTDGVQKAMVDYYKSEGHDLRVTVYMLAHHGAESKANKQVMRDAVRPRAVFVSSNPWYSTKLRHPRCSITDYFKKQNLCKPGQTDLKNKFYCGQHPKEGSNKLQKTFTCGAKSGDPPTTDKKNEFAIYSTTPSKNEINLIHLMTDGVKWGFINDIQPRSPRRGV